MIEKIIEQIESKSSAKLIVSAYHQAHLSAFLFVSGADAININPSTLTTMLIYEYRMYKELHTIFNSNPELYGLEVVKAFETYYQEMLNRNPTASIDNEV